MNRGGVAGALAVLALGCAHSAPAARGRTVMAAAAGDPGPLRWVSEAARRATLAGASPPQLVASGAGSPGDSLGSRIRVPRDSCGLVLVGGSPSLADLDVFVYADDGAVLAADEAVGRGAAALVCPPHAEDLYAFGRVASGHGLVSVSLQLVAPGSAESAALAAGARGTLAEHSLARDAWPGLDDAITRHHARGQGLWKEVRRVAVPLDPRVPTHVTVPVEGGTCVDVLAVPADDVAFVEISALDADGALLGRSADGSETASLLLCAATRTSTTLSLRPRAGRGFAALVTSVLEGTAPAPVGGRRAVLVDPRATLPLMEARRSLATELREAGYAEGRTVATGSTRAGERAHFDVALPGGCVRIDLVAGAPTAELSARLWSREGALHAEGRGARGVTLFPCSAAGPSRLAVDAELMPGPIAIELRTLPPGSPALAEQPLAASRLLGRLARNRTGAELAGLSPRKVHLSPHALVLEEITLAAGACLSVALTSGIGLEGLEIAAVDSSSGVSFGLARGEVEAELELCASGGGPQQVRLELRSSAGTGAALLGVVPRASGRSR